VVLYEEQEFESNVWGSDYNQNMGGKNLSWRRSQVHCGDLDFFVRMKLTRMVVGLWSFCLLIWRRGKIRCLWRFDGIVDVLSVSVRFGH